MAARWLALLLASAVVGSAWLVAGAPEPSARAHPLAAALQPVLVTATQDPFNYSDVVLLGNNNSATSRNLTAHFAQVRGVPSNNVLLADLPVAETISPTEWGAFASWFKGEMGNRSLGSQINYIVTFKGVPIRVSWANANGPTSFQDELMLLGGSYEASIGDAGLYGFGNPYFNSTNRFSYAATGFRLVTGIYAYNESTAVALIDRSARSLGVRGEYVLDADSSKGFSGGWGGYGYANEALLWANATLWAAGESTYLDANTTYVTGRSNVMGYSSWGSNDCCWGGVVDEAKPHNTWLNGSIGETFVSTGGRTFTWPPSYGQSLIADWIDEGATGMKGYTDEPYILAIADAHILYGRYARGYNLAESYWAASHQLGWRQIVVGDPKMAPYADVPELGGALSGPSSVPQFGKLNLTLDLAPSGAVNETVDVSWSVSGAAGGNFTLAVPASARARYNLTLDFGGLDPGLWGPTQVSLDFDPGNGIRSWNESTKHNTTGYGVEILRLPLASCALERPRVLTGEPANLSAGAPRADRPIDHFEVYVDGAWAGNISALGDNGTFSLAFPKSGNRSFTVVAVDGLGLASPAAGPCNVTVLNRAPTAVIATNNSAPLSLELVAFNASSSFDPDGRVAYFTWDAGAQGGGGGPLFTVAFPRAGNFRINLTVTDDEGATAAAFLDVVVANRAPLARITANVSSELTWVPVAFSGADSSDPDGSIVRYDFLFDDGAHYNQGTPEVVRAFALPGALGVWLEVTDDSGATNRTRISVTIGDRPPTAAWDAATPFEVDQGVDAPFRATLSDPDSNLTFYRLDFGDGIRVTGALTGRDQRVGGPHAYTAPGNFTITLVVSDEWGGEATLQLAVAVVHPAPVVDTGTVEVRGLNLTVRYSITSPYDTLELVVLLDGHAWRQVPVPRSGTYTAALPGLAAGNHTVAVAVTDGDQTTDLGSASFTVEEAAPPPPPPSDGGGGPGAQAAIPAVVWGAVALGAALAIIGWAEWRRRKAGR